MRDAAREMFNFPAPELPRAKLRRKGMSAEEQEQADLEDEANERRLKVKQNLALKLARDTAAYRANVAGMLAGDITPLVVLRALHEATPQFMRFM